MMAARPGTLTMMAVAGPTTPVTKRSQLVHRFTSLNTSFVFDAKKCFNPEPFVIRPNENHVLLTDAPPIYRALLNKDDVQAPFKAVLPALQSNFNIQLKEQGVAISVGRNTPLALVLNSGCFTVTHLAATAEQVNHVLTQPEPIPSSNDDDDEPDRLVIDFPR